MAELLYTCDHVGLYADGTRGHAYVRGCLADVLWQAALSNGYANAELEHLYLSLMADEEHWPDDLGDEDDALEYLNEHSTSAVCWCLDQGDLCLLPIGEEY